MNQSLAASLAIVSMIVATGSMACKSAPEDDAVASESRAAQGTAYQRLVPASEVSRTKLGVVRWLATYSAKGGMAVGGADAAQNARVEYISDGVNAELRTPSGSFETLRGEDGSISSDTLGRSAESQYVLTLMLADLAQVDGAEPSAMEPAALGGRLAPLGDPSIVAPPEETPELVKECNGINGPDDDGDGENEIGSRYFQCQAIAGEWANKEKDRIEACQVQAGPRPPDCRPAGPTGAYIDRLNQFHCFRCRGVWNITTKDLLYCPRWETKTILGFERAWYCQFPGAAPR